MEVHIIVVRKIELVGAERIPRAGVLHEPVWEPCIAEGGPVDVGRFHLGAARSEHPDVLGAEEVRVVPLPRQQVAHGNRARHAPGRVDNHPAQFTGHLGGRPIGLSND